MDKKDLEEGVTKDCGKDDKLNDEVKNGEKDNKLDDEVIDDEVKDYRGKDIVYGTENREIDYLLVKEPPGPAYKAERIYTYEDYLNWPEEERVELIDGKIYYMAAPSKKHQELLRRLSNSFTNYLHGKSCDIYFAPFDVRIDLDIGKDSTFQPDLIVICDDEKLDEKGLNGSPDFVIEILSKSTASRDRVIKYNKYLRVGVKEYWIVDPFHETVIVNLLTSGKYMDKTYTKGDVIKVEILDDLYINVTNLFDGYFGNEVEEVEVAREEERVKAEKLLQQAEDEKDKLLQQVETEKDELLQQAETEKLETVKRLLKMGLSNTDTAHGAGVGIDVVQKVSKELKIK